MFLIKEESMSSCKYPVNVKNNACGLDTWNSVFHSAMFIYRHSKATKLCRDIYSDVYSI